MTRNSVGLIQNLITERITNAYTLLANARKAGNRILQYYLAAFIDCHIHLRLHKHSYKTIQSIYDDGVQPEIQRPINQDSIPDYITSMKVDIWNSIPEDPILKLCAKSIFIIRYRRHCFDEFARMPEVQPFLRMCAHASILGMYQHANFNPTHQSITVHQRIELTSPANIDIIVKTKAEIIVAEYVAAFMPIQPFTTQIGNIPWSKFVNDAIHNANYSIRKYSAPKQHQHQHQAATTTTIIPTKKNHLTAAQIAANHKIVFTHCLMETGHNFTAVCITCKSLSAYIRNAPRGIKRTEIAINPYGKPNDPNPPTNCRKCKTKLFRVDLHGLFVSLRPKLAVIVCPQCDHVHQAPHPLISTLCSVCTAKAEIAKKKHLYNCIYDGVPIERQYLMFQYFIVTSNAPEMRREPVCKWHYQRNAVLIAEKPFEALTMVSHHPAQLQLPPDEAQPMSLH